MSTDTAMHFVTQLRQAQLLDDAQMREVERLQQTATRPVSLAAELVKRGWLTTYQANQIATGRGDALGIGSYVLLEPLAQGGMGQVFKARHRFLKRQVALKLVGPEQRDQTNVTERFQREVELLANLQHPHIVQAHDAGNIGDTWFLAMELLDGVDLDKLVKKSGPLAVGQACAVIQQAALGLHHAHERGLVHRDVKPSNLFLTTEGIKLLDLGLARPQTFDGGAQTSDLTRANSIMGTPDYLAPEQALDPRRASPQSDLYSLGCTLYYLLAGRPPFPDGTLAQKLLSHQQTEPPTLQSLGTDVPPAVTHLLKRLLAKAAQQRFSSAAEVADRMGPLATTLPDLYAPAVSTNVREGRVAHTNTKSAVVETPEQGFTLNDSISASADSLSMPASVSVSVSDNTVMTDASLSSPSIASTNVRRLWSMLTASPQRIALAVGAVVAVVFLGLIFLVGVVWFVGQVLLGPSQPDTTTRAATTTQNGEKRKPINRNKNKVQPLPKPNPKRFLKSISRFEVANTAAKVDVSPILAKAKAGSKVYLSELPEFGVYKGGHNRGGFEKRGQLLHKKSLAMTVSFFGGYTRVCYRLDGHAKQLHGIIGLTKQGQMGLSDASVFVIYGDGNILWRGHLEAQEATKKFSLDVHDVDVLELRIFPDDKALGKGRHGASCLWLDPYVLVQKRPAGFQPLRRAHIHGNALIAGLRASRQYRDQGPTSAFDGNLETVWSSGGFAPAWIEADFGQQETLKAIKLNCSQNWAGRTKHEIWISNTPIGDNPKVATKIHTFDQVTNRKEWLHYTFPKGTTARYLQIKTINSVGWSNWYEIGIDVE